jgi:colanic acid biosynthesis glycosyl transferase WcaI
MGRTFLLLSQVYPPDPASVGQHMADAAAELARRGHRVVVLTADRGYDDPATRYPGREVRGGVEVRRLPWCSFGKRSMALRMLGGISYAVQATLRGLFVARLGTVVVSTAPPMAGLAALVVSVLRGARLKFWVMDLNPDQMVALGLISAASPAVRLLDGLNRLVLARAADVIVLDRFMADRVNRKLDVSDKLTVLPPWPLSEALEPVAPGDNPFRRAQGLDGKFVVMYSGNHSPSNPLDTLLRAAERVGDDPRLVFLFIGGGVGKQEVEASAGANIRSLPYQPLDQLNDSLSAADVHLVTMGDSVVGVIHPCKVYGALAASRPVIFVGPEPSHVSDIIADHRVGWRLRHGDVDGAERLFRSLPAMSPAELTDMGRRARRLATGGLSREALRGRLVDVLERPPEGVGRQRAGRPEDGSLGSP